MFPDCVVSALTRTLHASVASSAERMCFFPALGPTLGAPGPLRHGEEGLRVRMPGGQGAPLCQLDPMGVNFLTAHDGAPTPAY